MYCPARPGPYGEEPASSSRGWLRRPGDRGARQSSSQDCHQSLDGWRPSQAGVCSIDPTGQGHGSVAFEKGIAAVHEDRWRSAELNRLGVRGRRDLAVAHLDVRVACLAERRAQALVGHRPVGHPSKSPFAHARAGLATLLALSLLKALAVGQFLAVLSAGATSALLVVLARDRRGGGEGFGVLVAAIGAGAALGPMLRLRHIAEPRRPLFVFGPYAVRGVVDLLLTVVTTVPLAAAALLFYGLSTSTGNVTFSSSHRARLRAALPRRRKAAAAMTIPTAEEVGTALDLAATW